MLSLEDQRWSDLEGGYRMKFDPTPLLHNLQSGKNVEETWHELWEELHHQGDVGEASYAAVPHLVRIHREHNLPNWNTYAIVGVIELARGEGHNPKVPEWLDQDYKSALHELAEIGTSELMRTQDSEEIRAILAILAISRGARIYGRLLLNYSEQELLEFESSFMDGTTRRAPAP
jgi:hypothetical protein